MTFIPPDIALVRPSADPAPRAAAKNGRGEDDGFTRALDRASRKHEAPESAPDRASHARQNRRPDREREARECGESAAACEAAKRDGGEVDADAPAEQLAGADDAPDGSPETNTGLDHKSGDDHGAAMADGEPAAAPPPAAKPEIPANPAAAAPAVSNQATPAQGADALAKRGLAAIVSARQSTPPAQAPANAVPFDGHEQAPPTPSAESAPKAAAAEAGKEAARAAVADLVLPRRSSDTSNLREPARVTFASSSAATSLPRPLVNSAAMMQTNETVAAPAATVAATAPSSASILAELPTTAAAVQAGSADALSQQPAFAASPAESIQAKTAASAALAAPREIARAVPLADVSLRIASAAADGVDHLRIVLDPPELGRVDVKITLDDGRIAAALMVDRPETLELLQRDSRALERALNDAGFKTDSDSLDFNLRGHRHARHEDAPQQGRPGPEDADGNGMSLTDGRRILDAALAQAWRPPHRVGGLDIRA